MILSASSHPAKIMHARRNPNLNISAAASALSPASTLSPRTPRGIPPSFDQSLLGSTPPPSPSLPSLLPRHGKRNTPTHSRLIKRFLIAFTGVIILGWLVVRNWYSGGSYAQSPYTSQDGGEDYEMVGDSMLPEEPSVVMLTDAKGSTKWTVSIPPYYDFPLRPAQYSEICSQAKDISQHMNHHGSRSLLSKRHLSYYTEDKYFMDVHEAEEQQLLPHSQNVLERPRTALLRGGKDITGSGSKGNAFKGSEMKVCKKSLTYVLETSDAGIGKTLMGLWMSYGLAKKEDRAFFIDDARWPYGSYTKYFVPPTAPHCLPPPPSQIIPCPHQARHLLVSAATTHYTFGHQFVDQWEDAKKMEVWRQHKIFDMLRVGYEALFRLIPEDEAYVEARVKELYGEARANDGTSVGMHVRRGDRHPFEFQYSKDYLPLDRYVDTATEIITKKLGLLNDETANITAEELHTLSAAAAKSKIVLASDDPDIYSAPEMASTVRAQDRIVLASKTTLEEAAGGASASWLDEVSGWEGGFFKNVFWGLGMPHGGKPAPGSGGLKGELQKEKHEEASEQALELRALVGRAYLLDLAVLGKADAVVCTVSSTGCRLLGVMMGWQSAIEKDNWHNVDGTWHWRGIEW